MAEELNVKTVVRLILTKNLKIGKACAKMVLKPPNVEGSTSARTSFKQNCTSGTLCGGILKRLVVVDKKRHELRINLS